MVTVQPLARNLMERLNYSADSANRTYRITRRDMRGAHVRVEARSVVRRVLLFVHGDLEYTFRVFRWQRHQLRPPIHLTRQGD